MFYLLNKRKDISSFKAIKEFAKENNIDKIGHTGTLDPMATGLLLVATDDDTKLIEYIDKGSKTYIAQMQLNKSSDTLDSEGKVEEYNIEYDEDKIEEVIMSFIKTYDQIPPMFSAKKVDGKRMYELAREGKKIELKPSSVTIDSIQNIRKIEKDIYEFEVTVSRGTYIRSLIRDIGKELGTFAIMTSLVRTKLSNLSIETSPRVVEDFELITKNILKGIDIDLILKGLPMSINEPNGEYAIEFKNKVVGIVEIIDNKISKRRLFGKKIERLKNEN